MRLDPIDDARRTYKYTVKVEHIIRDGQILYEPLKIFDKKMEALEYIKSLHMMYRDMKNDKKPSIGGVHPAKIARVTNIYLYTEETIKNSYIVLDGE